MRNRLVLAVVLLQIVVLGWMAGSREYLLAFGQPVALQTAPVDPRDLFRGDYVRLTYRLGTLPASLLAPDLREREMPSGQQLYVWLERLDSGRVLARRISLNRPESQQLVLRGRLQHAWQPEKTAAHVVHLRYGIEQYFVEQGKGLEIEARRGRRNTWQTPLLMEVRVADSGEALLKGHRWADFAVRLQVIMAGQGRRQPGSLQNAQDHENSQDRSQSAAVLRFAIKNSSQVPHSLPFRAGNCSLLLHSVAEAPQAITLKPAGCDNSKPETVTLQPQEVREFVLDLNQSHWQVSFKGATTPLGLLPWEYRFRIVYAEPGASESLHTVIESPAFHPRGQID